MAESLLDFIGKLIGALGTVGGLGAFLKFLTDFFAQRKIEEYKASHQREIETLKSQLAASNIRQSRYYEKQFSTYAEIWEHLQRVKTKADELWLQATEEDLEEFAKLLFDTKAFIAQKSLFLEEKQYKDLKVLLEKLSRYDNGKYELINIRKMERPNHLRADRIVQGNMDLVDQYTRLIERIRKNLRNQLKM